jgi:hypothetical protein
MTTRREFLKYSALIGAAAGFPVHLALAQENQARRDPLFIAPFREIRATAPRPRVMTIPDVGNYTVLKGDIHMHTLFSDGDVMPRDRVREAVQNGFDYISITDHIEHRPFLSSGRLRFAENNDNHNVAYEVARPEAERSNLILIRGTEITKWTMPPGHFNAIFIEDANAIAAVVDDWQEMLAVAADQGGFVFWNHPGWVAPQSGGLEPGVPMAFLDEHEYVRQRGHLHGIEIFNDTSLYPIVHDWCNEKDLGIVCVSDAHQSEHAMYGLQNPRRPITLVLAEERTEASIREAFFAHRTIGWVGDMIFGKPEWVERLFRACVEVRVEVFLSNPPTPPRSFILRNRGDIPLHLQVDNNSFELLPQGEVSIPRQDADTLRVTNWYVGTDTPLEISLASLRLGR